MKGTQVCNASKFNSTKLWSNLPTRDALTDMEENLVKNQWAERRNTQAVVFLTVSGMFSVYTEQRTHSLQVLYPSITVFVLSLYALMVSHFAHACSLKVLVYGADILRVYLPQ